MKMDKSYSITLERTPAEAMASIIRLLQVPDIPKDTLADIEFLRDIIHEVASETFLDEFIFIVKIRCDPK